MTQRTFRITGRMSAWPIWDFFPRVIANHPIALLTWAACSWGSNHLEKLADKKAKSEREKDGKAWGVREPPRYLRTEREYRESARVSIGSERASRLKPGIPKPNSCTRGKPS